LEFLIWGFEECNLSKLSNKTANTHSNTPNISHFCSLSICLRHPTLISSEQLKWTADWRCIFIPELIKNVIWDWISLLADLRTIFAELDIISCNIQLEDQQLWLPCFVWEKEILSIGRFYILVIIFTHETTLLNIDNTKLANTMTKYACFVKLLLF